MEGIQGMGRQTYVSLPKTQKKQTGSTSGSAKDTFDYSPYASSSRTTLCHPSKQFSLNRIRDLGSRYDSTNLTRNQFNAFIKELRDCGEITQKAFSDVYTGAAPQGSDLSPLPAGAETADWVPLLAQRSQDCADSAAPNGEDLAASYEQVRRAINVLNIYYDRYPESSDEIAARIVKENYRSPEELGIPDLTGMSDDQKLNLLTKLHKQTDYSALNDVERYKLISDRFETVFPNRMLYTTYCFGGRVDPSRPWDGYGNRKGMQDYIRDEFDEQLSDAGLYGSFGGTTTLHEFAYYNRQYKIDKDGHCHGTGSGSVSDETRRAIICLRHNNGETAADQVAILQELRMCTQSYNADGFHSFGIVRSDLIDKVGPDAPPLWDSLDDLITDSLECDEVLDKILVGKLAERGIQAEPMYPAGRNAAWIDRYMEHRSEISSEELMLHLSDNLAKELEKNPDWFLRDYQRTLLTQRAQADLSSMLEKILQEEMKKMEDELEETVG